MSSLLLNFGDFARYIGDFLMISSRIVLISKIRQTKSVSGLSLQTQFIYLIAYIFRYLDLFNIPAKYSRRRIYNTIMKILFISYQMYLVYLILIKYYNTYDKRNDNFNFPLIFGVCFVLAFILKGETFSITDYIEELLYTCSLLLESVAILPQLIMIQQVGDCESMTSHFIVLLGLYRLFYVINFVIRRYYGSPIDYLIIITSIIQIVLYIDFFAVYYKYVLKNTKLIFEQSRTRKL